MFVSIKHSSQQPISEYETKRAVYLCCTVLLRISVAFTFCGCSCALFFGSPSSEVKKKEATKRDKKESKLGTICVCVIVAVIYSITFFSCAFRVCFVSILKQENSEGDKNSIDKCLCRLPNVDFQFHFILLKDMFFFTSVFICNFCSALLLVDIFFRLDFCRHSILL